MNTFLKLLGAVAVISFAVGCGSPNGTGTGGGSATGGSSGTGGGSGATGGGSGSTGGGAGSTTKTGLIYVNQICVMGLGFCGGSATVTFSTVTATGSASCQTTTSGACHVTECLAGDGGFTPVSDSAGALSVAGTLADGGINMAFSGAGYPTYTTSGRLWQGGETLTLTAAGATVPAISAKTVTAPADVMVSSPVCTAGCGALSRSADLNVAWTGTGNVDVIISSAKASQNELIICSFSSSPGTVPASLMAKVLPSGTGVTNYLTVAPESSTTFNAGDYLVTFTAAGTGTVGTFTTN